jgi:polysaccharide chain length determinant protein (PEP-CTERM system associated)
MRDLLSQLLGYLWGVWRFRWTALITAWCVAIIGWIVIAQIPDEYRATARIHVDSNQVLRPLLRGLAIQPDVTQRVGLMSRTLITRPNLEKLMRMADLDLQVKTDAEKEKMLEKLKKKIRLSGERRNSSLYSVAFTHHDRQTAKKIVQSLITVFIESTLGEERKESDNAHEFLDQQIAEYEQRLIEAENRLAEFKRENAGEMPGAKGDYYQRLQNETLQLREAKLQLKEAENRQEELAEQLEDFEDEGEEDLLGLEEGGGEDSQIPTKLDERILILNKKLDELLLRFTERHPEVKHIRGLLRTLEESRKKEIARIKATQDPAQTGLASNPVYQQMRAMLTEADARVAELNVRVQEYSQRVEDLQAKVDNIPKIEAELKQLDRDYSAVSKQYAALVSRRESAHLSGEVEENVEDVKFRVIDPPFVPLKPTEPNKLLLNAFVLFIGVGAGVGVGFLLSLLHPVFSNRRSLGQATGLPVLGAVLLIQTEKEKRKALKGVLAFSAATVALLMVFVGVNMLQGLGSVGGQKKLGALPETPWVAMQSTTTDTNTLDLILKSKRQLLFQGERRNTTFNVISDS